MPEIADAKKAPLFADLSTAEMNRLFGMMQPVQVAAGEFLFKEGEQADGLYVLGAGSVEILKTIAGQTVAVAELSAPAVLGEMGLIGGAGRTASVRAKSLSTAQRLPSASYGKLVAAGDPAAVKLLMSLTRVLTERLAATTERLARTLLQPEKSDHRDLAELRDRMMRNWTV